MRHRSLRRVVVSGVTLALLLVDAVSSNVMLIEPSNTKPLFQYGEGIPVRFYTSSNLSEGTFAQYCVQVDAESDDDAERTQCLPTDVTPRDRYDLELSPLRVGTHKIRVVRRSALGKIVESSSYALVDVVPRKGGNIFIPVVRDDSSNSNLGTVEKSVYKSYDACRRDHQLHRLVSQTWRAVERTLSQERTVQLESFLRSETHAFEEPARIGFLGFGNEFGGQELLDMEQIGILEDFGSYSGSSFRAFYITPRDMKPQRAREIESRNITYVTFSSDDDLEMIMGVNGLRLDIVVVALHTPQEAFESLNIARRAGVMVRVLQMPNMFGVAESTELCDAAHVVVFPSCFAMYHALTAGCRASQAATIVIPPASLPTRPTSTILSGTANRRDTFTFVTAGRLAPEKSPGMYVRTAAYLRDVIARRSAANTSLPIYFRFVHLGTGVLADELRDLTRQLEVIEPTQRVSVEFRGAVAHDEAIRVLTEEADAYFVYHRGETFGISVAEAMSVGVAPIVCRNSGGPSENVDDGVTGIVVDCDSVDDVVNGLLAAVNMSPEHRRRVGKNARRAALGRFGKWAFSRRYASLYQMLLMLLRK
eukprot:g639.t1